MNKKNLSMLTAVALVATTGLLIANTASARNQRADDMTADLPPQAMGQQLPPQAGSELAPSDMSIVDIALGNPNFSTLVAAVSKAGLVDALSGEGQFTVFAPTNDAFDQAAADLGAGSGEDLVDALSVDELTNILLYHVTEGRRNSQSVLAAPQYEMLNGSLLSQGELDLNTDLIDISASNGIIHVINSVLLPQ